MQMVIACGGLATRLGAIARDTPKSMVDVNGKPFLEYQLRLAKENGFDEVVLLVGHLKQKIMQYFGTGARFRLRLHYSVDEQLGIIGALKNAENLLGKTFFLMYGDSYLPSFKFNEMYRDFRSRDKLALMSVWKNENLIDKSNIGVRDGNVVQVGMSSCDYIDYGVIILDRDSLDCVRRNVQYGTEEFWRALALKNQLGAYEVHERFYDIGRPERLEEVRGLLKGGEDEGDRGHNALQ